MTGTLGASRSAGPPDQSAVEDAHEVLEDVDEESEDPFASLEPLDELAPFASLEPLDDEPDEEPEELLLERESVL